MNPMTLTLTAAAAWLTGMFIAWAFVHGAQILRREEAAQMASEAVAPEDPATIQPMAPVAEQLPTAA